MPWRRVDDAFGRHPKVEALRDLGAKRFTSAMAVWLLAGCHASVSDGTFSGSLVGRLGVSCGPRAVRDLTSVGLIDDLGGGRYAFHNWEDYNETADEKREKRRANAERQRRHRSRNSGKPEAAVTPEVTRDVTRDLARVRSRPVPSRPVPDPLGSIPPPPVSGEGVASHPPSPDVVVPSEQASLALVADPPKPAKRKPRKAKPPAATTATWAAYAEAYEQRYSVEPVRNAKINGQLSQLLKRIPLDEAPHIARFYVEHNGRWYVTKAHPVGALLDDAEKLRMEWATNRRITTGDAKNAEAVDEFTAQSRRVEALMARMDGT